jgi:hypothetical protein
MPRVEAMINRSTIVYTLITLEELELVRILKFDKFTKFQVNFSCG